MNNKKVLHLVHGAIIAALYAAATVLISPLSYGAVQFRLSEALTVISVFTPAAVPGLTIGCIIANLASPYGIWDIIFGSAATLLAAITARKLRNFTFRGIPVLSVIMPVIFNAVIVGAEIAILTPADSSRLALFAVSALQVGAGELAVCLLGGIPLYCAVRKTNIFK